jgi:hypothetical protein
VSKIVAGFDSSLGGNGDPRTTRYCPTNYLSPNIAALSANTVLMSFLKANRSELRTITTNSNADISQNMVNICNSTRVVNIITLYMAAFLGSPLDINKIVNTFVYDYTALYRYPFYNYQPFTIYPPQNLAGFPGLEQAYWTIVMQYTTANEYYLRYYKDNYWCSDQGSGVFLF